MKIRRSSMRLAGLAVCLGSVLLALAAARPEHLRFVILGDRTGEAVPGVYEAVWTEVAKEHPDFVINVGDTIQGGNDATAEGEWRAIRRFLVPYRLTPLFFVPGNHDVWSDMSAQIYQKQTKRPLHYSFDRGPAHFTVLDNSRAEALPEGELSFLRSDLEANRGRKIKFVFFHRPSWIIQVLLRNPDFPLHQIAKQYGVQYVICGHLHEMLAFDLEGVHYLSLGSSGGHLRGPKTYERGWFFQHTSVNVRDMSVHFGIKELGAPYGQGRETSIEDWGSSGLRSGNQ
jgi:predicted phosphodiesterase